MRFERTQQFVESYQKLTEAEKNQVQPRLRLLAENPRHPSLRARKWSGAIWYARASRDLRIYYRVVEDAYFLLNVGHHDIERSV